MVYAFSFFYLWSNIGELFKLVLSFSGTCIRHEEVTKFLKRFSRETLEKEGSLETQE